MNVYERENIRSICQWNECKRRKIVEEARIVLVIMTRSIMSLEKEYKIQTWIHTATPTWFFTKSSKTHNGETTDSLANVAEKTGYLQAENWN
jgi:hypothetical protein